MKKSIIKLPFRLAFIILLFAIGSCSKEKISDGWVVSNSSLTIGAQNNTTIGHFYRPQNGQVIAVENTASQQQYLALMYFTESGGANKFLTFPADGQDASTFGVNSIRTFTQNPDGVNFWPTESLVSGLIYLSSMTSIQFDNLVAKKKWEEFNKAFKDFNNGNENLSYKLHYELNPNVGNVYLIQFNGMVRSILCVRNIASSATNAGSIRFDIITEGKEAYANSPSAKYIQPPKPN